ncbi:bypass of stop codon protein 1-like isoform X2 [Argonauta hians]
MQQVILIFLLSALLQAIHRCNGAPANSFSLRKLKRFDEDLENHTVPHKVLGEVKSSRFNESQDEGTRVPGQQAYDLLPTIDFIANITTNIVDDVNTATTSLNITTFSNSTNTSSSKSSISIGITTPSSGTSTSSSSTSKSINSGTSGRDDSKVPSKPKSQFYAIQTEIENLKKQVITYKIILAVVSICLGIAVLLFIFYIISVKKNSLDIDQPLYNTKNYEDRKTNKKAEQTTVRLSSFLPHVDYGTNENDSDDPDTNDNSISSFQTRKKTNPNS